MSEKILQWFPFFIIFLALINACGNDKIGKLTSAPVGLTLGIQPDGAEMTGLVLLAKDLGLFKKNGLQITYKEYASGGQALSALNKKEVDLAFTGEFIFLKNLLMGADIRIIASIATSESIRVVAQKGIGIKTPSDLKGRRIALISESSCEFDVRVFLLYHGIKINDVNIIRLSTPKAVYEAFINGTVDAAVLWEPYVMMIKHNLDNLIYDWPPHRGKQFFWIVSAQEQFVRQNAHKVHQFLTVLRKAEVFMENNPVAAGQAIYKQSKHSKAHFDYIYSLVRCELILDHSLLIALEDQARWLISDRQTDYGKMPNLLGYFYFNGLRQVKPEGIHIVH